MLLPPILMPSARCVHTGGGECKAALRGIAEHFGNIVDFAIAVDVARQKGVACASPCDVLGKAGVVEMLELSSTPRRLHTSNACVRRSSSAKWRNSAWPRCRQPPPWLESKHAETTGHPTRLHG